MHSFLLAVVGSSSLDCQRSKFDFHYRSNSLYNYQWQKVLFSPSSKFLVAAAAGAGVDKAIRPWGAVDQCCSCLQRQSATYHLPSCILLTFYE